MKRIFFVIFLLGVLIAPSSTMASAPPPPGMGEGMGNYPPGAFKWWLQSDIVAELKLNSTQISQIDTIALQGRKEEIKLHSDVELSQAELDNVMDQEKLDTKQAATLIDDFVAKHSALEKARMLTLLKIRSILSKDQHLKLKQIIMRKIRPPMMGPDGRQ